MAQSSTLVQVRKSRLESLHARTLVLHLASFAHKSFAEGLHSRLMQLPLRMQVSLSSVVPPSPVAG